MSDTKTQVTLEYEDSQNKKTTAQKIDNCKHQNKIRQGLTVIRKTKFNSIQQKNVRRYEQPRQLHFSASINRAWLDLRRNRSMY